MSLQKQDSQGSGSLNSVKDSSPTTGGISGTLPTRNDGAIDYDGRQYYCDKDDFIDFFLLIFC